MCRQDGVSFLYIFEYSTYKPKKVPVAEKKTQQQTNRKKEYVCIVFE